MLEHFARFTTLRSIDTPLGAVPQFATDAALPAAIVGQPYASEIATSGGDGARTLTIVGTYLDPGLQIANGHISGTPTRSRKNFILARVHDADGDPAWRIFSLETFGGPGTLLQSDFRGVSPALHLPWVKTFVRASPLMWSGWSLGPGVVPKAGDDALVFSVTGPAAANETLAQALADNQYLRSNVSGVLDLRGAEVRFSTRRIDFHAPLGYALFTNLTGFAESNALYVSSSVSKDNFDEIEHVLTLPSSEAFAAIQGTLELRIYAFGAQFDGHATSLTGFKLTQVVRGRRRAVSPR
jgi:hypothetical protein